MPRKIRELVRDSKKAGWYQVIGGKGDHRKFKHDNAKILVVIPDGDNKDAKPYLETGQKRQSMNPADRYHLVVYWSDEDKCYVGLCPDLFYGGTHGDDPEQVFRDLRAIVADVVHSYQAEGKPLPNPRDLIAA